MNFTFKSSNYVSSGGRNLSREKENALREGLFTDLQISYLKHADFLNTKDSSIPGFFRVVVTKKEYSNLTQDTIIESLYDPVLGVLPMIGGLTIEECLTCKKMTEENEMCDAKSCKKVTCKGGHFGVILFTNVKNYLKREEEGPKLGPKPVKNYNKIFNPKEAPFTEAIKIASCVCNVCKKLILAKNYLEKKNVLKTPEVNRLALVVELTKRVAPAERECKCKKREYVRTISRNDGQLYYKEGNSKKPAAPPIDANEWYDMMRQLEKDDSLKYLGYNKLTDLDKCTLVGVVVPGIEMRPPKMINGTQMPHEYTDALSKIVDASKRWKEAIRHTKIVDKLRDLQIDYIGNAALEAEKALIVKLERKKANLLNSRAANTGEKLASITAQLGGAVLRKDLLEKIMLKFPGSWPGEATVKFEDGTNKVESMRHLYKMVKAYTDLVGDRFLTKEGVMRGEVNAKRSDFSARAVITPSSYRIDVVEIPEYMASECGIQDTVTEANLTQYRIMLAQGRISHVFSYRGGSYLPFYVTPQTIAAGRCRIQVGDKITRWLMDNDVALVNRQPSLHPGNMYAFFAKIVPEVTGGIPFAVTVPFAGDFDGDTVSITFPQSPEAREEAMRLAHSKKNIIGVRTGAPIMGIIYNALKSIHVMTSMEKLIPKYVFYDALAVIEMIGGGVPDIASFRSRCVAHGIHPLSGKALFSYLLPENFNYPPDGRPNARGVLIRNGILVKGAIKKQEVAANIQGTIVHYIQTHYGWEAAGSFIESGSLLGEYFSQHFPSAMPATNCLGLRCREDREAVSKELEQITDKIRELGPEPSDAYELELYNAKLARIHQKTGVINQNLYNRFAKEEAKEVWKNNYAQIRAAYEKLTLATRNGDYRLLRQDELTRDTATRLMAKMRIETLDFTRVLDSPLPERSVKQLVRNIRDAVKVQAITEAESGTLLAVVREGDPVTPEARAVLAKVAVVTPNYPRVITALYEGLALTDKDIEDVKSLQEFIAQEYWRLSNMDELTYNQFYLGIQAGTKGSEQEFGEMIGIIGQLSTSETVFAKDTSGGTRCSTMFRVNDPDPVSRGFIAGNYVSGLTGDEKFQSHKPQREAAAIGVGATPDAGVIEKELANSIGKYRTELNAITSETDHLLQLLAGNDGLGVYKSIEVNGVQLPFDPRTLVEFVNNELGWVKLPDDKWYRKHTFNGKTYYVKLA